MHYAVLDGISPDYPAVAGRLHTCYSPVRRSPAGKGKPSPPLPLDLHVLSLSLAFILSQDQTLRCCLSISIFFQKSKCDKQNFNLLLLSLGGLSFAALWTLNLYGYSELT